MATTWLLLAIGDPDGTRTIVSIVALLVALGVGLLILALWIFRTTRPDPELLAPLEAMGDRSWRRGDPVWQRRRLDDLRPPGARPLAPSVAPPELDEAFDAGPAATGFDDLRRPVEIAFAESAPEAPRDSTPAGVAGPTLDGFPDDEFDEEALEAARAELDRELAQSHADGHPDPQQLDLFGRDTNP